MTTSLNGRYFSVLLNAQVKNGIICRSANAFFDISGQLFGELPFFVPSPLAEGPSHNYFKNQKQHNIYFQL